MKRNWRSFLVAFILTIAIAISFSGYLYDGAISEPLTYKFGIPPWQKGQDIDDIRSRYKPMLDQLGKEIGAKFVIVGSKDYEEISELLADGKVQLASISPAPFILAQRKLPGIKMLVTELSWNRDRTQKQDFYQSLIVSLKKRKDISTLLDLKGKSFGFVNKRSTSGFQVPNALFKKRGIEYKKFFNNVFFLDSHPRITDAIASGSIDAGATWDFNLAEAIRKHGDIFKIILRSSPIPNVGIAVHPSVPISIQDKIRNVLQGIDPQLLKGLATAGYVVRPDSYYDVIRKAIDVNSSEKL